MPEFKFLQNPLSKKWVINAPRRAGRPDVMKDQTSVCPFCPGREKDEPEAFRVGGIFPDSNWQLRIVTNKYPFAPIHEIVIHSQNHHKNFGQLENSQTELIFKTFRQRFQTHEKSGQVYIFHNRGESAGESLPHPHSQLTVIPNEVKLDIPVLNPQDFEKDRIESENFYIFCPETSEWPDEVWIAPKTQGKSFKDASDKEISDISKVLSKLILVMEGKLGKEFPYNFYIYPGSNWYLRITPRKKILGGFEVGTNVSVNTQDPLETFSFLKNNF